MSVARVPTPVDGRPAAPAAGAGAALRSELITALDHDLRTSLTTVLGALQTVARPELAPDDPELAALVTAALVQAQKMGRLLDELPAAAAPEKATPLLPAEVADVIRRAGETGARGAVTAEVPDRLGEILLPAPGLRRALAGILRRVESSGCAVRVSVGGRRAECHFTIITGDGALPAVPTLTERLVAAMGGSIEQAEAAGLPVLRLVFPGAIRGGRD